MTYGCKEYSYLFIFKRMKFAILVLKASMLCLVTAPILYLVFYCYGDGPDPVEVETVLTVVFAAVGIFLSLLLTSKAYHLSKWLFWLFFVLFLLVFTVPAIVTIVFLLIFI